MIYDILVKTIIVGDENVGKTSFLDCVMDLPFVPVGTTIGIDFKNKIINYENKIINFQFWDTAGAERFRSISRSFFRGSCITILVFDFTNRKSFDNLEKWLIDISKYSNNTRVLLIGNKFDSNNKEISIKEVNDFVEKYHLIFLEFDCASRKNADNISITLCKMLYSDSYFYVPKETKSFFDYFCCCQKRVSYHGLEKNVIEYHSPSYVSPTY